MDKTEKIKNALSSLQNDIITFSKLQEFITALVKIVKESKDNNDKVSKETKDSLDRVITYLDNENTRLLNAINGELNKTDTKLTQKIDKSISDMKYMCEEMMLSKPQDGEPGKDADEQSIIDKVMSMIKLPEYQIESSETIKEKLESLTGEDRLDAKAIKNLPKMVQGYVTGGNAGGPKGLVAGTNITIDNTDPQYPKINSTGGSGTGQVNTIVAGTGISVNSTDPANPIVTNTNPTPYTLPVASVSVLGGVKQGSNISIDANGVISSIASGTGDVVGPASAVDSNFASFNTTTGKLIKDSGSKASDFATSTQGGKADTALQPAAIGVSVLAQRTFGTAANNNTGDFYLSTNPSGFTSNTGTVTSVAALTLGTTGTDLSSTVANGTTTPVITLQVPTASASNRGALSAADWSTFNGKGVGTWTDSSTNTGTNKTLNSNTNYIDADATHQKVFLNLGRAGVIGDVVYVGAWNVANQCSEVSLARANSQTTLPCAGVLESAGADGTVQSMRVEGILNNVNTNAWSAGTRLYVSAATAGVLTSTRPTTPNFDQAVATVSFQNATVGVLDVIRTAYVGTMAYADTASYQTILTNPITGTGTTNELSYWASASTQGTLAVATYPSLTEISYVKGVTSAIQTQINAKGAGTVTAVSVVTANGVSGSSSGGATPALTIALGAITPTSTNGVSAATMAFNDATSSIQTQLNGKQASGSYLTAASTLDATKISGAIPSAVTATTQSANDNSTKIATTAYVDAKPAGGFWTAITATRTANTTFTLVGDQTAIFKKGLVVKWTESSTIRCAMVSIPSTFSSVTTVTICGDTMASIDASSFKYASAGVEGFYERFAIAGNIGATGTDNANVFYAHEPMRVLGADMYAGTAGTTNSTTVNIVNGTGTVTLASPTLGSTVAVTATPVVAASALSLALNDRVQLNITAIQTTNAIDLYCKLYLYPTRLIYLS